MNLPNRRKLGAVALIVAGIGAFLVPFLLHAPTPQGTPTSPGGKDTTKTTTPNPTTTPTTTPADNSGGGTNTGTCDEDSSPDPTHSNNGNHNGQQKHSTLQSVKDDIDSTVAQMKAMGAKNPAFHATHTTDTDNHTVHSHDTDVHSNHGDHDGNGCAEDEEDRDE